MQDPSVFGIPVDFILFGLTLAGVAVFHKCTMRAALTGLVTVIIYKIAFKGFKTGEGVMGFISHVGHEWVFWSACCAFRWFCAVVPAFRKKPAAIGTSKISSSRLERRVCFAGVG